ncbi:MAG: ATP-dependent DNA helicase RecG [Turicibacter sp.]|nr:ATP-dependent DNA helicase RecG [Turicibacter sp.]
MQITEIPGIGTARAKLLANVHTVEDLVNYFPRNYVDRTQIKTISSLDVDVVQTIKATIVQGADNSVVKGKNITKLLLSDEGGSLEIVWFGRAYLKHVFKEGETYIFTGKVRENFYKLQMESPEYEKIDELQTDSVNSGRIVPLYTLPKGISQKMFRKWMKIALDMVSDKETVTLPVTHLMPRVEAIKNIHFPTSNEAFYAARHRLVFEEFFFMQLALSKLKAADFPGVVIDCRNLSNFFLPFTLTDSQKAVIEDIKKDLHSGKCMNRLVQGDVGSGKTVVAAIAAYFAVSAGYKVAIMAPTEVLARQHLKQFRIFFQGVKISLLVGSLLEREKRAIYEAIAADEPQIIIGTHALIQEKPIFNKLALVITDEQHRFGVKQRASLSNKGIYPHTMIMTATPIPRTLALILYGDMDISTIKSMPPNRQPIQTFCVNSAYRPRIMVFIEKQVALGNQVYIICPAIEDAEGINAVITYTKVLQNALPHIPITLIHGKLKNKDEIMTDFAAGKYSVLVATTVIEVGVDVPKANLIIIENAERFGLAQLHQLRGRVGRGSVQSYCILITDSKNAQTLERMRALESTTDGFVLSEFDLKRRGPGDFFGLRQHGLPEFKIANLYTDLEILKEVQATLKT